MERFMMVLREDCKKLGLMTPDERLAIVPKMLEWIKSIAEFGQFVAAEPLAISGAYVTRDQILSDGPFIESKEGVSGYIIIMAESIKQAISFAQGCPVVVLGLGALEVRPILTMPEI